MPFEQLMTQITAAHGLTQYMGNQQGKAINVRLGSTHYRSTTYKIYSHAAYGSRNSNAPPAQLGSYMWRITFGQPDGAAQLITARFRGPGINLATVRTPPVGQSYKEIKDRDSRNVVAQVTDKALYLLFDIEQAEEPEVLLRQIYEAYVLGMDEQRGREVMKCFRETDAERNRRLELEAAARRPVEPIPPVEEGPRTTIGGFRARRARPEPQPAVTAPPPVEAPVGKGVTWNFIKKKNDLPPVPERSQPEELIYAMVHSRKEGMRRQLTESETRLRDAENRYKAKLRELNAAREALNKEQDISSCLLLGINGNAHSPDDMTVTILQGVLEAHYEKVWKTGDCFWALTRPIVIQYSPTTKGEQDPCRVLAGKFLVKVSKDCSVHFYRDDGRMVKEPNTDGMHGGRGWAVSPHNSFEWDEDGSICWGTHRTMIQEAQKAADYAQIFLLTAQHIAYLNPDESYVSLRGYAKYLDLPMIEDPLVKDFQDFMKLEEEKKAKEAEEKLKAEQEKARAEQERLRLEQAEETRRKANQGEELGDLTPEELTRLGLNPDGSPPDQEWQPVPDVHEDHMDAELMADTNELEGR